MPNNSTKISMADATETSIGDHMVNYIKRFAVRNEGEMNLNVPLRQVEKAVSYLSRKCTVLSGFQCKLGTSRELTRSAENPVEIFSSGIILDLLHDTSSPPEISASIVRFIHSTMDPETKTFNFFQDRSIMADDVDTTAVSLWGLLHHPHGISKEEALPSVRAILNNVNSSSGIIESFFPPYLNQRGQLDVVTIANALRILYYLDVNVEGSLEPTEDFVEHHLRNENCGFGDGLAYYDSFDAILYFLCNAVELNERAEMRFGHLIRERLIKRLGVSRYPLDLAMRIMTAVKMGLLDEDNEEVIQEVRKEAVILAGLQKSNGSWPKDSIYRYKGWYFGSATVSTAFALKAIKMFAEKVQDFQ